MARLIEHEYSVEVNNFGYSIHFVFTDSPQRSWLKRFNTDESGMAMLKDAAGTHTIQAGGHSFIILPWDCGVKDMVHECWHAVYALLKWAGIPLDNNELIAYTLGFIISEGQTFQIRNDKKLGRNQPCRTKKRKSRKPSKRSAKQFSRFKVQ